MVRAGLCRNRTTLAYTRILVTARVLWPGPVALHRIPRSLPNIRFRQALPGSLGLSGEFELGILVALYISLYRKVKHVHSAGMRPNGAMRFNEGHANSIPHFMLLQGMGIESVRTKLGLAPANSPRCPNPPLDPGT